MTTDTSKAPERMWRENIAPSRMYPSGGSFYHETMPTKPSVEYVRADIHAAMQARAEKVEATIGLKDALIQEERRVRVRAETARDGLRHAVEGLEAERDAIRAENERLREALRPFAEYMQTDEGRLDRDNHGNDLPDNDGVGWVYLTHGDFRAARAALERKEGA